MLCKRGKLISATHIQPKEMKTLNSYIYYLNLRLEKYSHFTISIIFKPYPIDPIEFVLHYLASIYYMCSTNWEVVEKNEIISQYLKPFQGIWIKWIWLVFVCVVVVHVLIGAFPSFTKQQ